MMFVAMFVVAFFLTILYMFAIKALTRKVQQRDPVYWAEISQAKVFGRGDELGVFNKLYSPSMTVACEGIGESRLLRLVRFLFPITLALNIAAIFTIVWLHEQ
jgi:hypothetical protein